MTRKYSKEDGFQNRIIRNNVKMEENRKVQCQRQREKFHIESVVVHGQDVAEG